MLTKGERAALAIVGAVALAGLGVLAWQQQRPPLAVTRSLSAPETARWDRRLKASRQVDVNAAAVAELERLPEIGPSLARRIVAYREAHGGFRSIDELARVAGIGPKTLQALQGYVTVQPPHYGRNDQ